MPCYGVRFVYIHPRDAKGLRCNEHLLENLSRQYRSPIEKIAEFENHSLYGVALCDLEAADLLRDLPSSFFCDQIVNLADKRFLYKNYKIYDGYRNSLPQSPLEKRIFWNAKQMERWVRM